jgi:alkylation response protein AidB-like acyl-CoA dehydrogenase
MDFTLTDEQELLRDTARALFAKECPIERVRAGIDDPGATGGLWTDHLREWVVLGDGDLVDHCLFLEEAGAALAPEPYFATSALFLPLLRAAGHELADAAATGEVTGTVALAGADGVWRPSGDPVRTFVPAADRVDHVAVVFADGSVTVTEPGAVGIREVETLDGTRRVFELDVGAVPGTGWSPTTPVGPEVIEQVVRRATVALAAELVGVSRWLLDTSVAYARERVQFDRPIGSFQAVQHKLVDMALDHERAAAAVAYAAMAVDAGDPDAARAAHVAKAAAGTAARHAARDGLQVHGGIGYTWEHDLHLYLRRAYAADALMGSSAWHHDRLAELLFDRASPA